MANASGGQAGYFSDVTCGQMFSMNAPSVPGFIALTRFARFFFFFRFFRTIVSQVLVA
jgi:hypothetical protein